MVVILDLITNLTDTGERASKGRLCRMDVYFVKLDRFDSGWH